MIKEPFSLMFVGCAHAAPAQPQQRQRPSRPKPATTQPQNPPDVESQGRVRKITTSLVRVGAVVTRDGKQLTDLKPEEFQLFEDGKPGNDHKFFLTSQTSLRRLQTSPRDAS